MIIHVDKDKICLLIDKEYYNLVGTTFLFFLKLFLFLHLYLMHFLTNNFIQIYMQKLGVSVRRRSYEEVIPSFPRKIQTQEDGKRTLHKQLPNLDQQLKSFRRKVILDTLPASEFFLNNKNRNTKENSKILSDNAFKNNQTLITMGSQTDVKTNKNVGINFQSTNDHEQLSNINNYGRNQFEGISSFKLNVDDDYRVNTNYNTFYNEIQGYTMGNQIEGEDEASEQDKNKYVPKLKSYSSNAERIVKNFYEAENEPQLRMQQKYLQGNYQNMKNRREQSQMIRFINIYKTQKQNILKEGKRKFQSMKVLAQIKRASSLPKLPNLNKQPSNQIKQIIVPSYQELMNPDGNPEERMKKLANRRLEASFSVGKLLTKNKQKGINFNYQQKLEDELGFAIQTQRALREKGIQIDTRIIRSSLVNIRQTPVDSVADGEQKNLIPKTNLLSNPFFPKDKTKKKQ